MRWPWSKPEPVVEKRESYTDALVSAILSSRGESAALAQDTAIAEIAAGQLGRTLSSGTIQPKSDMLRAMIKPHLTTIGFELIKNGECAFWISPDGSLIPSSYWDINGGYNPKSWQYRLDLSGPSFHGTVNVNAKDVLHFRYRSDTIRPWRGIGPLQGAGLTSKLVSGLERMLGNETSATSGYLLPVPEFGGDSEDDPAQALKDDLAKLKGRTTLLETTSNAYGEGRQAAPQRDLISSRIGANPPGALIALREQAAAYLLTACGYPVGLMASGDGQSQREGLRRYQNFVASVAQDLCSEISLKLHVMDCKLQLPSIQDIATRARSYQSFVLAGMSHEQAAAQSGLMLDDE